MTIKRSSIAGLMLLLIAAVAVPTASADTLCTACIDTGSDDGSELLIAAPGEDRGSDTDAGLAHLLVDGTTSVTLGEGRDIGILEHDVAEVREVWNLMFVGHALFRNDRAKTGRQRGNCGGPHASRGTAARQNHGIDLMPGQ